MRGDIGGTSMLFSRIDKITQVYYSFGLKHNKRSKHTQKRVEIKDIGVTPPAYDVAEASTCTLSSQKNKTSINKNICACNTVFESSGSLSPKKTHIRNMQEDTIIASKNSPTQSKKQKNKKNPGEQEGNLPDDAKKMQKNKKSNLKHYKQSDTIKNDVPFEKSKRTYKVMSPNNKSIHSEIDKCYKNCTGIPMTSKEEKRSSNFFKRHGSKGDEIKLKPGNWSPVNVLKFEQKPKDTFCQGGLCSKTYRCSRQPKCACESKNELKPVKNKHERKQKNKVTCLCHESKSNNYERVENVFAEGPKKTNTLCLCPDVKLNKNAGDQNVIAERSKKNKISCLCHDIKPNKDERVQEVFANKPICKEGLCAEAIKNKDLSFICKCKLRKQNATNEVNECTDITCNVPKINESNTTIVKLRDKISCLCHKYTQKIQDKRRSIVKNSPVGGNVCEAGLCKEALEKYNKIIKCTCKKKSIKECTESTCSLEKSSTLHKNQNISKNKEKILKKGSKQNGKNLNFKVEQTERRIDESNTDKTNVTNDSVSKKNEKNIVKDIRKGGKNMKNIRNDKNESRRKNETKMKSGTKQNDKSKNSKVENKAKCSEDCELNTAIKKKSKRKINKKIKKEKTEQNIIDVNPKDLDKSRVTNSNISKNTIRRFCHRCRYKNAPASKTKRKLLNAKRVTMNKPEIDNESKERSENSSSQEINAIETSGARRCYSIRRSQAINNPGFKICVNVNEKNNKKRTWYYRRFPICRCKDCKKKTLKQPKVVKGTGECGDVLCIKHGDTSSCGACCKCQKKQNTLVKCKSFICSSFASLFGKKQPGDTTNKGIIKDTTNKGIISAPIKGNVQNEQKRKNCECLHDCECHLATAKGKKEKKKKKKTKSRSKKKKTKGSLQKSLQNSLKGDAKRTKQLRKKDKAADKKQKKIQKRELKELLRQTEGKEQLQETSCVADFFLGIGKLTFNIVKKALFVIYRIITRPRMSLLYVKVKVADPTRTLEEIGKWVCVSWRRQKLQMSRTMGASYTMGILSDTFKETAVFQAFSGKGKTKKEKRLIAQESKRRKRRIQKRNDEALYGCKHTLLTTLRKTPCMWVYHICPNFYPQCLSLLAFWKKFSNMMLFCLAFAVWTPCIVTCELCRGLMCCTLCMG